MFFLLLDIKWALFRWKLDFGGMFRIVGSAGMKCRGGMTVQTDDVTAVEGSGGLYSRAVPSEVNGNINDSFHGLVPRYNFLFFRGKFLTIPFLRKRYRN